MIYVDSYKVKALYEKGHSPRDIGRIMICSRTKVIDCLDSLNVKRRPRKEALKLKEKINGARIVSARCCYHCIHCDTRPDSYEPVISCLVNAGRDIEYTDYCYKFERIRHE
jgi:hypothetical protein